MEDCEVIRNIRTSKPKKKNAKGSLVRSAENEERRREAVKQTLGVKLELERKALQIVERLLEDNMTEEFVISCVWHITPANYKDAVEERSIAKLCGYPLCSNKLKNVPTQQFTISTKTNRVFDITERKYFCSNFCYKASKCLELQISKTPLWLRKEETPPEIKLMREGDRGSSGQEVKLLDKPITKANIENPFQEVAEALRDSPPFGQSDSSDTEQDFVSSVITKPHKHARVHWGKLPKKDGHTDNDGPSCEQNETAFPERADSRNIIENRSPLQKDPELSSSEVKFLNSHVEGTRELLKRCNLEDGHTVSHQETSVPSQHETGNTTPASCGLNITQVGMSKRGAAGLKGLLKDHNKVKSASKAINLCMVERLRETFVEWKTEETMKFLYGPGYGSETESKAQVEEELDEDDLDEAELDDGLRGLTKPQRETRQRAPDSETHYCGKAYQEVRILWFSCVQVVSTGKMCSFLHPSTEQINLPLNYSLFPLVLLSALLTSQHNCSLANVYSPPSLYMIYVCNLIYNLLAWFQYSATGLWMLMIHGSAAKHYLFCRLTEVSPLLKESLASPSSVEYISSLMRELKLNDKDLHSLVLLFKPQIISQA
ncbi:putative RNA polymerase II subunit B1 CTD phosphatase rpap2 [Triplophysa tibetana]|uniref:RNA polymerase II subunit B1 CTD phosphatase RPAP2 homolog n=1 Tax=Triplophysa tibetana TaxID=1572043 RepID=A0A5A9PCY4_9TELE|nr:putative RNA polymerase II subunit B1 CTD phosphatase rpap2 [Triplophysa tibetana]